MKGKRGQAAMEFLMTHGWAFLGLTTILATLIFFGVHDIKRIAPDHCTFLSGLSCLDTRVVDSGNASFPSTLELVMRNELGFDIYNISMTIDGTCTSSTDTSGEIPPTTLLNSEQGLFSFGCPNISQFDIEERVSIDFINLDTDIAHHKVGYITLRQ